jgi:hypothetical protein
MHDAVVDRTTNGTGNVSSMSLAQIQTLDAGSWFGPQFTGTPPPSLRDVMMATKDSYPSGILYLDCKVNGLARLSKPTRTPPVFLTTDSGSGFTIRLPKPPHIDPSFPMRKSFGAKTTGTTEQTSLPGLR